MLTFAAFAQGCSQSTTVDVTRYGQQWDQPHSRILIIGLSNSRNRRDRWETVMADTLRRSGMMAWASTSLMDPTTDLSRETILPVVEESGADLVLVTRLVREDVKASEVQGYTGAKTQRKTENPVIDFFRYDYKEYEEPGYVLLSTTVRLTTDVFETRAGRLLLTIDTTTRDKDSEFDLLVDVTEAIDRRLRREQLTARPQ